MKININRIIKIKLISEMLSKMLMFDKFIDIFLIKYTSNNLWIYMKTL